MRLHFFLLISVILFISGCCFKSAIKSDGYNYLRLDTVSSSLIDLGKMWTFDYPPIGYFEKTYGINPTKDWFDKIRLSALRLPNCSASFISEDGLVMTNHHCARMALDSVNLEGENLVENGFYADSLHKERKVPSLYIDQLVLIEDVTSEVQEAFESGKTDEEKIKRQLDKIEEIRKKYRDNFKQSNPLDSMVFSVVSLYNGGKFSVYGYKRYTDVRLVYAPENVVAFFGGDFDNFTYPRYDFDCAFFRVYENGKPIKTSNFFKIKPEGANEGEAVFVVGNPGSTQRLFTVAQLKFLRDLDYPARLELLENASSTYKEYVKSHENEKSIYLTQIFSIENSKKALRGYLDGLRDPYLMAKKIDFENKFKNTLLKQVKYGSKYGNIWSDIEKHQEELSRIFPEYNALRFQGRYSSKLLSLAVDLVKLAKENKDSIPDSAKANLYPKDLNLEIEPGLIQYRLALMKKIFGDKNDALNKLMNGKSPEQSSKELVAVSILASKEKVDSLLNSSSSNIINCNDPLIEFAVSIHEQFKSIKAKYYGLNDELRSSVQMLGKALYDLYGPQISPDATFTLRISDGLIKGYEYNGTIAPPFTTFYGLYDRYYSFDKKEPWNLPKRWVEVPNNFDMSTPLNFVSTNDVIGGNSGSPVINKDLEVVGLVFDGNIESLPGNFIYDERTNRTVSVHSSAIVEVLAKVYRAERLVKEILSTKCSY